VNEIFEHLTDSDIVAFEHRQFDLDPYSPVAAWVAAYTVVQVTDASGSVHRTVAAGLDTLFAMTIPARIAAASLRGVAEREEVIEYLSRCGPITSRVALIGGLEALVKTRYASSEAAYLAGDRPYTPVRAALVDPYDLADEGASTFVAGVIAAVDDPVAAVVETADLLETFLVAAHGIAGASDAFEEYATTWPTLRYYTVDDRRVAEPE
jgi:hypothetical protein